MTEEERTRRIKEFHDWENSLEGIHYRTTIIHSSKDVGRENESGLITKVLAKLPSDVRDDVIGNVAFIIANCSFPFLNTLSKKILIILSFGDQDDYDRANTVAHEIAHCRLEHLSGMAGSEGEKEADDLCESWGFGRAYESYDEESLR